MLRKVAELLACWKGRFGQNDFTIVWNVISSCLLFNVVHLERKKCLEF